MVCVSRGCVGIQTCPARERAMFMPLEMALRSEEWSFEFRVHEAIEYMDLYGFRAAREVIEDLGRSYLIRWPFADASISFSRRASLVCSCFALTIYQFIILR